MRLYLCLILIAVSMAFSAGYLLLSVRQLSESSTSVAEASTQIEQLKKDFIETHETIESPTPLGTPAQKAIARGEPLILSKRAVFLASDSGYLIFNRRSWDEALDESPFLAEPFRTGDTCLFREGNICWKSNISYLYQLTQRPTALLLAGSLLLTLFVLTLIFRKTLSQNREEARKRFALQTLTHELRTPLASLMVSLETLRNSFDQLPPDGQDSLMRICNDVQRLQRLTEASKQYLMSHGDQRIIHFSPKQIPSLKEYLETSLESYGDQVKLELPEGDGSYQFDPYWVGICLKNLVENAMVHGKPPVQVNARARNDLFEIAVEDQGECAGMTLGKLSIPFFKRKASPGLGLGLSITQKVVTEMGGTLEMRHSPTRFTMRVAEQA